MPSVTAAGDAVISCGAIVEASEQRHGWGIAERLPVPHRTGWEPLNADRDLVAVGVGCVETSLEDLPHSKSAAASSSSVAVGWSGAMEG